MMYDLQAPTFIYYIEKNDKIQQEAYFQRKVYISIRIPTEALRFLCGFAKMVKRQRKEGKG